MLASLRLSMLRHPSSVSARSMALVPVPHANMRVNSRAARIVAFAADASSAKVIVQGRGMTVTPAIKEYAESKIAKVLSNFEGAVKEVDFKVSAGNPGRGGEAHHSRNQTAEMTVYTLRLGVIRVEDTEDDLYAAIDLVTDKLKRKLSKVKERAIQKNQWPGRGGTKGGDVIADHLDAEAESSDDESTAAAAAAAAPIGDIVREKVLFLENSMTAEEAVYRLEAVGHDFFVFEDAADGVVKVLYRRKSQGYGLLIPQSGSQA